jgi:hypothetical protein
MTKISDVSNHSGFHQPVAFNAESQSVFKLNRPVLAQILDGLEQRFAPATRFLMNKKLANLPMPARQKINARLKNFVNEIRQQMQLENDRSFPPSHQYAPGYVHPRSQVSMDEMQRNPMASIPHRQVPSDRPQHYSVPHSSGTQPDAALPSTPRTESRRTSPKPENTASSEPVQAKLPRLSMRERPDASHIKQLRANGMSDSDLMTLKDDIRAIRESDGSTNRQESFDKKYAHVFDSTSEGGIRDNDKNYAVLWLLITREVRKTD